MNTNVNLGAAVGVLAFLGTAFVMGLAVIIILHSISARKRGRARAISLAALALIGFYLLALVVFSFFSREKILALGEEKHFCEIDCHLAYSVASVRKTKTLGSAPNEATARGIFYVVTIKTRFDETTISSARGNAPLTPNSRVVTIQDDLGNSYNQSVEAERVLDVSQSSSSKPFTMPLRPGESYTTDLVFDLPANAANPLLLIREGEFITHFIIGHENSFWHKQTKFRLES